MGERRPLQGQLVVWEWVPATAQLVGGPGPRVRVQTQRSVLFAHTMMTLHLAFLSLSGWSAAGG